MCMKNKHLNINIIDFIKPGVYYFYSDELKIVYVFFSNNPILQFGQIITKMNGGWLLPEFRTHHFDIGTFPLQPGDELSLLHSTVCIHLQNKGYRVINKFSIWSSKIISYKWQNKYYVAVFLKGARKRRLVGLFDNIAEAKSFEERHYIGKSIFFDIIYAPNKLTKEYLSAISTQEKRR